MEEGAKACPAARRVPRCGGEEVRHSRRAQNRAWVILAVLVVLYLAWTLTVYFLEPGLR